jgi:hypothetical protein
LVARKYLTNGSGGCIIDYKLSDYTKRMRGNTMQVTTLATAYYSMTRSDKKVWDNTGTIKVIYPSKPGHYTIVYEDGSCIVDKSGKYKVFVVKS